MLILERFARESGRDYALRTLKENIIRAELEPGAYISENELAAQLGLSRTPVREALIELSRCKAVEISPQKRSQVAYIDEALVEEARFARKVLEPAVAAQVCATATGEDLLRLDENVKLQEFFRSSGQLDSIMALDDTFHKILFDIAEKPELYDLVRNIAIHFDRVRCLALNVIQDVAIVDDHRAFLEALRRRDAAQAQTLMEQHLNRCEVDILEIRKKFPLYFKPDAKIA